MKRGAIPLLSRGRRLNNGHKFTYAYIRRCLLTAIRVRIQFSCENVDLMIDISTAEGTGGDSLHGRAFIAETHVATREQNY